MDFAKYESMKLETLKAKAASQIALRSALIETSHLDVKIQSTY